MPPPSNSSSPESVTREYSIEDQEQPLVAIVDAVSEATGVDQQNLVPLERVINVDALTALLKSTRSDFYRSAPSSAPDVKVRFHYKGCLVEVDRSKVVVQLD